MTPTSAVARFNSGLAVSGTRAFNTMWCFYAFAVYGALGAVFPNQQGPLLYWSNWIQLVSLPLLGVGLALTGRASVRQAQETHDAVMEELAILRAEAAERHNTVTAALADAGVPAVPDPRKEP